VQVDSNFSQLRHRIVTWIADLHEKFEFSPETLFLSVAVFDRFLVSVKVGSFALYINSNNNCNSNIFIFVFILRLTVCLFLQNIGLIIDLTAYDMSMYYFLARSAKVAERAICFTDRNFYLFFFLFFNLF